MSWALVARPLDWINRDWMILQASFHFYNRNRYIRVVEWLLITVINKVQKLNENIREKSTSHPLSNMALRWQEPFLNSFVISMVLLHRRLRHHSKLRHHHGTYLSNRDTLVQVKTISKRWCGRGRIVCTNPPLSQWYIRSIGQVCLSRQAHLFLLEDRTRKIHIRLII